MFLKKSNFFTEKKNNNTLSILGEGIDFSGEISTEGNVHIDGVMKGMIKAQEVVIGPGGNFDGEIVADILIINGIIKGKCNISSLHVKKSGLLQGKAKYDLIIVEAGGTIQGELGVNKQNKISNSKSSSKEKNGNKEKTQF